MSLIGYIHTLTAVVALTAGLAVILMPKGTRRHRQIGWVYVASMIALNVSALMIYRLFGRFGPFHYAAVFSLVSLIAALIPTIRRTSPSWLDRHYYGMTWSYVGLLAAAVSEVVTRGPETAFWWAVAGGTAFVIAVGGTIISRRAKPILAAHRQR